MKINNKLEILDLSFYKLVEFLKTYINSEKMEILIMIFLYIAQK